MGPGVICPGILECSCVPIWARPNASAVPSAPSPMVVTDNEVSCASPRIATLPAAPSDEARCASVCGTQDRCNVGRTSNGARCPPRTKDGTLAWDRVSDPGKCSFGHHTAVQVSAHLGGVLTDRCDVPPALPHTTVLDIGARTTDIVIGGCLGAIGSEAADAGLINFIVDSGADLHIAGAFIYPYSDIICRNPGISIKGVDGELTRVDAVVRTTAVFGDGQHAISEILVCDAFQIALWSVPFATHFGFAALLGAQGQPSLVRTPTGHEQPLTLNPYSMRLQCLSAAQAAAHQCTPGKARICYPAPTGAYTSERAGNATGLPNEVR